MRRIGPLEAVAKQESLDRPNDRMIGGTVGEDVLVSVEAEPAVVGAHLRQLFPGTVHARRCPHHHRTLRPVLLRKRIDGAAPVLLVQHYPTITEELEQVLGTHRRVDAFQADVAWKEIHFYLHDDPPFSRASAGVAEP